MTPHKSPDQIRREILEIQTQLAAIAMPPLPYLQREVARLTTLTALDPAHRADLYDANANLESGNAVHARVADLRQQLQHLQNDLTQAEYEQRMSRIALQNQALQRSIDEYLAAGTMLIRAYRRMLTEQAASARTPGASVTIPAGFDFLPANPPGWSGSTSEMLTNGPLPFEQLEQKVAA